MHAHWDGVLLSQWKVEQGHLVRRQRQPSEDDTLAFLSEVRKNPEALRDLSFGAVELSIPERAFLDLQRRFPGLTSQDHTERTKAWRHLLSLPECDKYRLRERKRPRALVNGLQ